MPTEAPPKHVTFRLDAQLAEQLAVLAARHDRTVSAELRWLVKRHVEQEQAR